MRAVARVTLTLTTDRGGHVSAIGAVFHMVGVHFHGTAPTDRAVLVGQCQSGYSLCNMVNELPFPCIFSVFYGQNCKRAL